METNFKSYTGTKTVKAQPMTAEEAQKSGARITDDTVAENDGRPGYLVEYPDGYRSWSPKEIFDAAYRLSETYVDRMKIELEQLRNRIVGGKKAFYTIDLMTDRQREKLGMQLRYMEQYADTLVSRIKEAETDNASHNE